MLLTQMSDMKKFPSNHNTSEKEERRSPNRRDHSTDILLGEKDKLFLKNSDITSD